MEKALIKFLDAAPSALITIGIIFLIVYLLREYRKIRKETEESVKNIVNAKLGEVMTNIQAEISRLELVAKEQGPKISKIEETYLAFLQDVEEKSEQIESLYKEANKKLLALKEAIPNVEEYSARDLLGLAQITENTQAKADICNHILSHQDSTAKELEAAGDLMRKEHRYTLAINLYDKACQKDPERIGVNIELLSLKAETEYSDRNNALNKAKELAIGRPDKNGFSRVSNALIDLDRYEELAEFSDLFIEKIGDKNLNLKTLALRNKGVAMRQLGNINEAMTAFNEAFSISPEDENTLKPYLGLLEEQGKDDEYLVLSRKLINIDPSDINYYRIYIAALVKVGNYNEASAWLKKTEVINMSDMDLARLDMLAKKIQAAANNATNSDS